MYHIHILDCYNYVNHKYIKYIYLIVCYLSAALPKTVMINYEGAACNYRLEC